MRADLDIIQDWIPAGSRVLDLGCGNGELLAWLRDHKQVSGYGLEIDPDNIATCIDKGVNVIEQNLDLGLGNFASDSFDMVVMKLAATLVLAVASVFAQAGTALAFRRSTVGAPRVDVAWFSASW